MFREAAPPADGDGGDCPGGVLPGHRVLPDADDEPSGAEGDARATGPQDGGADDDVDD